MFTELMNTLSEVTVKDILHNILVLILIGLTGYILLFV